jgi:uncharacterized protein with beta-barrel porin domain
VAALSLRASGSALGEWLELGPADGTPGSIRAWGQVGRRVGLSSGADPTSKFRFEGSQVATGLDYALDDGTRVGFGMSAQDGAVTGLAANGAAATDFRFVTVYAGHAWSDWRISGAVTVGDGNPTWTRTGLFGANIGRGDVDLAAGFLSATFAADLGPFIVKPNVAVLFERTRFGTTSESGSAGLTIPSYTRSTTRPRLGIRAVSRPGNIHPYLSVAASYEAKRPATATMAAFRDDPAAGFALSGPVPRRLWTTVQAGINVELGPGLMARAGYDGVVNDPLAHRGFTVGASYRW